MSQTCLSMSQEHYYYSKYKIKYRKFCKGYDSLKYAEDFDILQGTEYISDSSHIIDYLESLESLVINIDNYKDTNNLFLLEKSFNLKYLQISTAIESLNIRRNTLKTNSLKCLYIEGITKLRSLYIHPTNNLDSLKVLFCFTDYTRNFYSLFRLINNVEYLDLMTYRKIDFSGLENAHNLRVLKLHTNSTNIFRREDYPCKDRARYKFPDELYLLSKLEDIWIYNKLKGNINFDRLPYLNSMLINAYVEKYLKSLKNSKGIKHLYILKRKSTNPLIIRNELKNIENIYFLERKKGYLHFP